MLKLVGALCLGIAAAAPAAAQERVTYKSAKAGSSYYQMGVELAEAMRAGTDGAISVTVEESQGSVQNVMEARARGADYVFTTPPGLVSAAQAGTGPFEGKGDPAFAEIRALFPIPSLTMHFVMDAETGARTLGDMAGHTVLLGAGSFGATEGEAYLDLFGLAGQVEIADAELSNAVGALKNGQIDGFVTAGSWPAPNVIEAAATMPVTILSMTDEEVAETGRTRLEIPAGTYAGQDEPIVTTALDVVAFATTKMPEETAYTLTKTFWEEQARLADTARWWAGIAPEMLQGAGTDIHPGALRYYEEIGAEVGAGG